ncbi:MAG: 4-alpha-glucanotransferase [Chloroflexi bacterium RBG_16_56_11]|nr:MAG: 4-alpha-glucanotransferase [Chloroflexi bacterium RBG_16_56_11]
MNSKLAPIDVKSTPDLYRLAGMYGVQTSYFDMDHRRKTAPADSLLAALRALGAPLNSIADVPSALHERKKAIRVLEPVMVAWNGRLEVEICLPEGLAGVACPGRLQMESGETIDLVFSTDDLPFQKVIDVDGERYIRSKMAVRRRLPPGYHRLSAEITGRIYETLIISAPTEAYSPRGRDRLWGAFLPLYAIKKGDDWGGGDYSCLGRLADYVAGLGGKVVATLPLLPVFLDRPFEPSPYAPVSRLLWNEFYVDITKSPEMDSWSPARDMVTAASKEINRLRDTPLVDYRAVMALKRRVIEELYRGLILAGGSRLDELRSFVESHPCVAEYAAFRATLEKRGETWSRWPQRQRDGKLAGGDFDEHTRDYYLYAQWLADEQVKGVSDRALKKGLKIYFDLPLGVHPGGFDVWHQRGIFSLDASTGAPPDAVFTNGQDWGFPPLHPEKVREQGYRYVIDYLRHHFQHAGMLRLDHVMGLHRLFWIPRGIDASEGVYVRYRADELYAILSLESHRHRSAIVGEDLGIVPSYVRPTMSRHGLRRMYVLRYELADTETGTVRPIPARAVASLNTHDMPPFTAFWEEDDIREKKGLGLLDEAGARRESRDNRSVKRALSQFLRKTGYLKGGAAEVRDVLKACLAYLSASRAGVVLVNLEDLWLETRSQNMPGTGDRYPSWRRKARYSLDEISGMPEVAAVLREIDGRRKGKGG